MRRVALRALELLALALLAAVLLFIGLNVFLNTWLLVLLNAQPERVEMGWSWAWTWDARHVEVEGYTLRVQGPMDQWWLSVDHAELDVELAPLLEHRFQAEDVNAQGVVLHYRSRVDAPIPEGGRPVTYVEGRTAPIPGLEDPPLQRPEDLYPPTNAEPWLVGLDRVKVDDLREMWFGDYRFVGDGVVSGNVIVLPGSTLDLSGVNLEVLDGLVLWDDLPVLSDFSLTVDGSMEGVDTARDGGAELFRHVDATARLGGQVDDLRYVDIFLRDAPWVGISGGAGRLDAFLDVRDGVLRPGSEARAVVADVAAQVGTYAVVGDGSVDVRVDRDARLALALDEFAVFQGGGAPLVRGQGFRLDATTAIVGLDSPPSGFTAIATLPPSEVPSLARLNAYLPADIGLAVVGGRATVAGQARVEEDGDSVSGSLVFDASRARLSYAGMPITGAFRIAGNARGSLDKGRYDIGGSTFTVGGLSVGDKPAKWWGRLTVRDGWVATGADTFLAARADMACSDSAPFFQIAVGKRKVAPWVEKLVLLKDLRGEVKAEFGQTSLAIDHLAIRAPKAEVHLHLKQVADRTDALLFARFGLLAVATRVAGDEYTVQPLDARRWFHARLVEMGTPERMTSVEGRITEAGDQKGDTRKGIHIFGKDVRKLFKPKNGKGKEGGGSGGG
jgi:hypothetical protein